MISIIIPTYNEEKNLPKLLKSIKKQKYKELELIVSDANSTDNTKKIAKKFNCKIIKGGLPAKGRNNGAKIAKGELLIFLDADTQLQNNFIKNVEKKFIGNNIDIAGVNLKPITKNYLEKIFHQFYNVFQRAMQNIDPLLSGACIIVKKEAFNKIKGFDETIKIAEDHAIARKAKKIGLKFKIIDEYILLDTRRFEKEGRIIFSMKLVVLWFRRMFGEIRNTNIEYDLTSR